MSRPVKLAEWLSDWFCFSLISMTKNTNVRRSVREGARKFSVGYALSVEIAVPLSS